jgi:signal transduction histidine kinase
MSNKQTLADRFIHPSQRASSKVYTNAKMLVNVSLLTSLFTFLYALICLTIGFKLGVYLMILDVVGFLSVAFLVSRNVNLLVLSNLYIGIGTFAIYYLITFTGGLYSPVISWIIATPILALLVVNRGSAITWCLIMLLGILFFTYLEVFEITPESEILEEWNFVASIAVLVGLMLLIFIITLIFEKEKTKAMFEAYGKNNELTKVIKELTKIKNRLAIGHENIKKKNTQLVEQQRKIVAQKEKLKSLNEDKDYIIEVLAHDLKEPLNSIDGLLDLIVKDNNPLSQNQRECIDHIQKTNTKSRKLLSKILISGELDNKKVKVSPERTELCELIQNTIDTYLKTAHKKEIKIVRHCNKIEIPMITDVVLVTQIFQNILSNSIKFSPKNSTVSIVIEQMEKNVKIEFIDQGPGIAEHEKELLFDKYSKLSTKPTDGESSFGLGLSLVKRYSDLLGAKIWYESKEQNGANFTLLLPLKLK